MKTWSLINYFDVLGNAKDGYEVNDQCIEFADLVIADDATDKDILNYLKKIGFLTTSDMRKLMIEDLGDHIEISKKDGYPICGLSINN